MHELRGRAHALDDTFPRPIGLGGGQDANRLSGRDAGDVLVEHPDLSARRLVRRDLDKVVRAGPAARGFCADRPR